MTTLLFQLGNVPPSTVKLRPPEDTKPYLSLSIRGLLNDHSGRKFAYRTDKQLEWSHGLRESLYAFISEHSGAMVLVRLRKDVL